MIQFLGSLYVLTVAAMSIYGLLGLFTIWLYWRHRHDTFPAPAVAPADLPTVTVQLPTYNERYVITQLVEAAVSLDYPRDKLQIQIVDDSTDETAQLAAALAAQYQQQGVNITCVQRAERVGYKAGALANALQQATGEFVAIFDADFQPKPDFLQETIPHFCDNPRLGMIQARWGHLNVDESPLTAVQAIALDKHFAMEQTVRHRANLFPKFNGAAGIWRRVSIDDAGGWLDDTVCEDLCLSTRAILKQWEFRFLTEVEAPAELPVSMNAYKNQQARWAKGSMQCFLKYGRAILSTPYHTIGARLYALLSMSAYITHIFILLLLLLQVPLIYLNYHFSPYMMVFSIAGVGQPVLFVLGQRVLYADWGRRLRHFPTLLIIAIGMAPNNSRALIEAAARRTHEFVRTPKKGFGGQLANQNVYKLPFDWIVLIELFLALYASLGLGLALQKGQFGALFLLSTCLLGFGYVAYLSLREIFTQSI
ncbi:MAG: glycosyltransferase [Chloroflexota bacterium]